MAITSLLRRTSLTSGVLAALLVVACQGPTEPTVTATDLGAEDDPEPAPAVPPTSADPVTEPEPEPEPEPVVEPDPAPPAVTIQHRTMPDWHLNTSFHWGPYGYPEVAQLVVIDEAFELTDVQLGFQAPTLLQDGFFEAELDWSVRGEMVEIPDQLRDVPATIRLTVFRGDQDLGGERISLDQLTEVSVQHLTDRFHADGERTRFTLPEPVELTPGPWLLAFLLLAEDPAILDMPINGRESGDNVERNPDAVGTCDYTRSENLYPAGAAYARGWLDHASFPTPWSDPAVFDRPLDDAYHLAEAKISECVQLGIYDGDQPMNPGDLELLLHGRELG